MNSSARWYDPEVGRWLSEDPIGFEAGDANLYRYVGNGVTGTTDPSGQKKFKIDGFVFFVHENDADPFPSRPHAHMDSANSPRKVNINTGEVFDGATSTNAFLKAKTLNRLRTAMKNAGLLGTAFTIVLVSGEIAEAATSEGASGAAAATADMVMESATAAGTSVVVGAAMISGAEAAGTSITLAGGSAAAGVGGAATVGGAVMVSGTIGGAIGYGIGSIHISNVKIHDHLGNAMASVYMSISSLWD